MTIARWSMPLLMSVAVTIGGARADDPATLNRTDAFIRAYGASYYEFDACGDGLSGRLWRQALSGKVASCPFSAAAKSSFRVRAAAQRRKSSEMMSDLIEEHGGLPVKLDGMTRTCREQQQSPEYVAVRTRLNDYADGRIGADAAVTQPCDAGTITP